MEDEVLIKFLLKETAEQENDAVKAWLESSPANRAYFSRFEKIWSVSKRLEQKSDINEEAAWDRFRKRVENQNPPPKAVRLIANSLWFRAAAILILISGLWITYRILTPEAYVSLTAENLILSKYLPDGSELTLNKNAEISYAADFVDNRSVRLKKGDVFFEVTHNKKKPFVIEAGKVTVTVVGTSFNVKRLNKQIEINVKTGIVRVTLGKQEVALKKGEKISINSEKSPLIVAKNSDLLYDYYHSRLIITNGTSLSRVTATLNEAYAAAIVIEDPKVKRMTIFTTFPLDSTLERNLETLCRTMKLKMVRNQHQILLSTIK